MNRFWFAVAVSLITLGVVGVVFSVTSFVVPNAFATSGPRPWFGFHAGAGWDGVHGTATSVSPTSLTITTRDGSTRTFALDSQTTIRRKGSEAGGQVMQGDTVAVVPREGGSTAAAVMVVPTGERWGKY